MNSQLSKAEQNQEIVQQLYDHIEGASHWKAFSSCPSQYIEDMAQVLAEQWMTPTVLKLGFMEYQALLVEMDNTARYQHSLSAGYTITTFTTSNGTVEIVKILGRKHYFRFE